MAIMFEISRAINLPMILSLLMSGFYHTGKLGACAPVCSTPTNQDLPVKITCIIIKILIKETIMSKTTDDLKTAFAGESQAFQKYSTFAKKAAQDGFTNIARLFATTAEAERTHAAGHLKALDAIGDTLANLETAIAGETYEFTEMYPPMLKEAEAVGHKAKTMFGFAVAAEEVHARLYKLALEAVQQGKDLEVSEFYLCPTCGYIELGKRPEKCPVCGIRGEKFGLISL